MTPMLPPPDPALKVSVVVPAHNEEELVGSRLRPLAYPSGVPAGGDGGSAGLASWTAATRLRSRAYQSGVPAEEYEVLLVLDSCTDETEKRALEVAAEHPDLRLHT